MRIIASGLILHSSMFMNFYIHAYDRESTVKPSDDAVNNNLTNGHAKYNGSIRNGEAKGKLANGIVANGIPNGTVTYMSIEANNGYVKNGYTNGHVHSDITEKEKVQ